jgi:GAF domain-containing protein
VLQPYLERTGPGRWPAFSAGALEAGIRAIFALPLRVGGIRLGVLDLYRDEAGELTAPDLAHALAFADAATALLLHLQAQPSLDESGLGAITVIEDRAEVHQATGMMSVTAGIDMAEALVRLRARAFATERPILDLARDVLSGAVSFDPAYDGDDEQ